MSADTAQGGPVLGARLELERLDPSRDSRRFYGLAVVLDRQLALFGGEGEAMLVVSHGRLGRWSHVRWERFTRFELLAQRWRELVTRRQRHGYRVTLQT